MKITKLTLSNFRQFCGTNILEFIATDEQNVTVVHGQNGTGKTTLLNAFKWCFYDKTDFDTERKHILNEQTVALALDDSEIYLSIKVEFEHKDCQYVAERKQLYQKVDNSNVEQIGGSVFGLSWTDCHGKFGRSKNPESEMSQILPQQMHSYFFFNGERIEKLSSESSNEIKDAIKTLMGLEILERAGSHLGKTKKIFLKQIQDSGNDEEKTLSEKQIVLVEKLEDQNRKIQICKDNIEQFELDIEDINKKFEESKLTADLQKERTKIGEKIIELDIQINSNNKSLKAVVNDFGFLAFIDALVDDVESVLEEKRKKGELPFAIKSQFIDDLLLRKSCICGTPLLVGSAEYSEVKEFKKSIDSENVEDTLIDISALLKTARFTREDLYKRIHNLLKDRESLKETKENLLGRLDEISKDVLKIEIEAENSLEQKRNDLITHSKNETKEQGSLEFQLKETEVDLDKIKRKLEELVQKSDETKLIQYQSNLAEECKRVITDLYEALSRETKKELSKRLNETIKKIYQKNYHAEIDENYCLKIIKPNPGENVQIQHGMSTGESQIASLVFISSIVKIAKESASKTKFFRGGIFPMVMDSPFGSLDNKHRQLIARHIPQLADQIILFVSDSQWKGAVEDECERYVAKHVTLKYVSPKNVNEEVGKGRFVSEDKYERTIFSGGWDG